MSDQQVSVVDIVSEARYGATFALTTFFGTTDIEDLGQFAPVINAMQGLPPQLVDEVGIPILNRFFEDEALDPKQSGDRDKAAPMAGVLATSINNAGQMIFNSMQQQAAREAQTRSKLLAPGGTVPLA